MELKRAILHQGPEQAEDVGVGDCSAISPKRKRAREPCGKLTGESSAPMSSAEEDKTRRRMFAAICAAGTSRTDGQAQSRRWPPLFAAALHASELADISGGAAASMVPASAWALPNALSDDVR